MAHSVKHLIEETERGVKVELGTLYVNEDGGMFLTFPDGTSWPMKDPLQTVELITYDLLRPMLKASQGRYARTKA